MGCLRYAAIAALAFLLSFMVVFSIIDLARAQETPAYEINLPHTPTVRDPWGEFPRTIVWNGWEICPA